MGTPAERDGRHRLHTHVKEISTCFIWETHAREAGRKGECGAGLCPLCYSSPVQVLLLLASLALHLVSVLLGEKQAPHTFLDPKARPSCQSYSQTVSIPSCTDDFTWACVWNTARFWSQNASEN